MKKTVIQHGCFPLDEIQKMKEHWQSYNERDVKYDAIVPYLFSSRNNRIGYDIFSEECAEWWIHLAVENPEDFFKYFDEIEIWDIQVYHVAIPIVREFFRQRNLAPLISLASNAPAAVDSTEAKWSKSVVLFAILIGIVEIMATVRAEMEGGKEWQSFGNLVHSILASRRDAVFVRIAFGAYLLDVLHGDVEEKDDDRRDVRAAKCMFKWLALPRSEWPGNAVNLLQVAWGCDLPQTDGKEWVRFKECGILPENQHPYPFMFLAVKMLDLPLPEEQLDNLLHSCFVSVPSSLYWTCKTPFSPLGLNIADCILQKESPGAFMKDVRTMIDAMWYRMRANHENKSVIHYQKIAELYLMVMVCIIDQMCRNRKFAEAQELFDLAWDDCVAGLYHGHGIWDAPANYIQYLFYYKVAFLSAFSGKWNNADLLDPLPLRGRDTESMTFREVCLGCLLKNEGGIPWDGIAKSDPQLKDEIEVFKKKDQGRPEIGPSGQRARRSGYPAG